MSFLTGCARTLHQYVRTAHGRHDALDDARALTCIAASCLLALAVLACLTAR